MAGYEKFQWPPSRRGVCTVHGSRVGAFTGLCFECHAESLVAAGHRDPRGVPVDDDPEGLGPWMRDLARAGG